MTHESRDYGQNGRLGLGTPQANPTVEAEMRRLIPLSTEYFTLRLTSESMDPATRLKSYLLDLPEFIRARFAGLQVDGFMFGCTASHYMVEPEVAAKVAEQAEKILGAPLVTATDALKNWFAARKVKTLAVATPYPDWLHKYAEKYWNEQGYELLAAQQTAIASDDTVGIYDLQSRDARPHIEALSETGADAIMISGTGMPSLRLIAEGRKMGLTIVSSNYALAEAGLALVGQEPLSLSA